MWSKHTFKRKKRIYFSVIRSQVDLLFSRTQPKHKHSSINVRQNNPKRKQLSTQLKQVTLMSKGSSSADEEKVRQARGHRTHMGLCWWTVAPGSAGKGGGWGCQPACSWPSWCWPWRTPAAGSGGFPDQTWPPEIKWKDASAIVQSFSTCRVKWNS